MSPGQNGGSDVILELRDLKTHFHTPDGVVKAVDGVTYSLNAGETLGVVGESGCGKSVTALSILRLIPEPPGQISGEGIFFEGKDLTKMNTKELRHIRGNEISMIFQEPMTSLNPVFTVGFQIAEAVMLHQELGKKDAYDKAVEMLDLVGIPLPGCFRGSSRPVAIKKLSCRRDDFVIPTTGEFSAPCSSFPSPPYRPLAVLY